MFLCLFKVKLWIPHLVKTLTGYLCHPLFETENSTHIHNGEKPLLFLIVPHSSHLALFKQLYRYLFCHCSDFVVTHTKLILLPAKLAIFPQTSK